MFAVPNKWFLLVVLLCRDSQAWKPEMSPDYPEIYMNEGESLELACTSLKKMQFYYPKDVGFTVSTSPENLEEQSSEKARKIIFRRNDTVHGDTGWYGCADEDVQVDSGVYDQPDVSWTYVWVKSNSSYFVEMDTLVSMRVTAGGVVTIPCRPTWPTYNVTLVSNHDTKIEMGGEASYDPKIGFKLNGVSLKDSGYYKCQIEDADGSTQEVNYHLNVLKRQVLKDPKIIKHTLRHVTRGQTLRVNCTITVESGSQYVLNWTTPQRDARITQRQYREPFRKNSQTATCELIINGVTDEDQGDYECTVATFSDMKKVKTRITVHDPDVKYINLTSIDEDTRYEKKYGDRIQWMVYVDAYPQPTLKWLNSRGDEIVGSWTDPDRSKHAINISSSMAILRINRLELSDMGLYSIQATNADRIETLNFTLDVLAKPIPMLDTPEAFYMPKRKANFRCRVAAFPAPDISWSFLRAPNYPSFQGSEATPLENSSITPKMTTFLSVLTMEIDVSGHLTCTACNSIGCDSVTDLLLVSDVPGGFGIIEEDTTELTVGDDVALTCAASVYNYTGVEWFNDQDDPILETEKISIYKTTTEFTHRSILRISNVSNYDNNSYYICSAKDEEGSIERYDYKLEIHDPVGPYFLETNMNKSEIAFDLSTEGHMTVVLKCYVGGMPMPNVTWYKDDTRIRVNGQYMCLHKNQELHIKYLLGENSGKYTCRADNRFGREENYQIILVKVKEVSKSLIISIVILVVICVILVIYFSVKMHREKVIRKQLMEAGLMHFEEGALECLNPDLTVDDQAELLPYDKKWEFPRSRLKFGKQLGFGAFGVVMKADAQGILEDEAVTTVAVKMVRRSTESTYIRALASELKIMVHLGKHLNVVNLLGACTNNITKRELLVIVEYCRFGNLHNYLLRHRADFVNQIDPTSGKLDPTIGLKVLARTTSVSRSNNSLSVNSCNGNNHERCATDSRGGIDVASPADGCVLSNNSSQPGWRSNYHGDYKDQNLKPICTQDLLSWAFQVARGMEYLSERKVLHGDLAARNILLAENNIVKICDFGLAKTMYKDENYKKKGDAPLPIKWMAIESIRDRVFSTQSDIWSFGIVLWEFFTLAKTPYPGMEAEKQYQRLIEGYRMEQPEYATDQVYDIMLQCWRAKPTLRPTFTYLVSGIGDLLEESVKEHYVDLNARYMDMNTLDLESGKSDYLTMMSAPDHEALSSPSRDYVNSARTSPGLSESYLPMSPSSEGGAESGVLGKFEFPSSVIDDSEPVETSPMLDEDEDNYLKPINVTERRAEFAKQQRQRRGTRNDDAATAGETASETTTTTTTTTTTSSNYRNAPLVVAPAAAARNDEGDRLKMSPVPSIIRTRDNYVNMPEHKIIDLRKDAPVSFSNPSYVMIAADTNNRKTEQAGV